MKKEVLRMEHVYVKKHGRYVLSDFKLNLYEGEFTALFGFSASGIYEAGDVLSGRQSIEKGRIFLSEKELNVKKEIFWEKEGVFSVYDEKNLMPDLTVAENLFFGGSNRPFSLVVPVKKQNILARRILDKFHVDIDVTKKARELSYDEQIIVRLVKAYTKGAKVVVLNEFAELAYIHGGAKILEILKFLKDDGIAVLWINHRIDSVKHLIDGISVLCDGWHVRSFYHENYTMAMLLRLAEDNDYRGEIKRPEGRETGTAMTFEGITSRYLNHISMEIRHNKITGIWANDPMSLEELHLIACGEKQTYAGKMYLRDMVYVPESYGAAVKKGVQYIDIAGYDKYGIWNMNIPDNLMLQNYWMQKPVFAPISKNWQKYIETGYRLRHPEYMEGKWYELPPDMQKLLLFERCLHQPGKVYFIRDPLSAFNYKMTEAAAGIFQELLDKGKTLVMLSSDARELTTVCDEIYLIQDRRLVRKVTAAEFENLDIWNYLS